MTEARDGGRVGKKSPMAPERGEGKGGHSRCIKEGEHGSDATVVCGCFIYLPQNSKYKRNIDIKNIYKTGYYCLIAMYQNIPSDFALKKIVQIP
jgi:hypothetical protein